MSAPLGNEYWKLRARSGPKFIYDNPDDLWADCQSYFGMRSTLTWNDQIVPFTLASLCIYLDISERVWRDWRKDRKDLIPVITRVDAIIRDQKLTGAMVGAYNGNIVARDLGLAEKQETKGEIKVGTINDFYADQDEPESDA